MDFYNWFVPRLMIFVCVGMVVATMVGLVAALGLIPTLAVLFAMIVGELLSWEAGEGMPGGVLPMVVVMLCYDVIAWVGFGPIGLAVATLLALAALVMYWVRDARRARRSAATGR